MCTVHAVPLQKIAKINKEFEKRKKESKSKCSKSKISLNGCGLTDDNFTLLLKVLAGHPCILTLDITDNPNLTVKSLLNLMHYFTLQLSVCESQTFVGSDSIVLATFLSEIYLDKNLQNMKEFNQVNELASIARVLNSKIALRRLILKEFLSVRFNY